ncbi:MAG: hypothetical protein ABIO76_04650, partial [Ginsengibacter sp.]
KPYNFEYSVFPHLSIYHYPSLRVKNNKIIPPVTKDFLWRFSPEKRFFNSRILQTVSPIAYREFSTSG